MDLQRAIRLWTLLGWMVLATSVHAAPLDPARWTVTELETGKNITREVTDNSLDTFITLRKPLGLVIDLGQTCVLHRVFLCGHQLKPQIWPKAYDNRNNPPLGLVIAFVGDSRDTTHQVAEFTVPYDAGDPIETEVDLRFLPAAGRYVRVELQTDVQWGKNHWPGNNDMAFIPRPGNPSWNIGEIEAYGFTGPEALTRDNAVVVAKDAAAPLALAANDLSYYLGELTGKPHPVIAPDETGQYPGTLYRVVDLKPLAPTYEEMLANQKAGLLPGGVNVERAGREVLFKAWPYRCVLWSVWEFLERQGIRWLYPDAHGDFLPVGKGVNLSLLPLKYTPSARSIYANWDAASLEPWPVWMKQAQLQGYLYPWRNRWNASWNTGPLGGAEIPARLPTGYVLKDEYKEGFDGYPHNFNSVVPDRILQAHPDWYGYSAASGKRKSGLAFCMSNPELIAWVADKMVEVNRATPLAARWPLDLRHFARAYNLLPMDACGYCECDTCAALNDPKQIDGVPWLTLSDQSISSYYSFVCAVANAVKTRAPDITVGALAYCDVYMPPQRIAQFPDNVQVEVCLYGAPGLPMNSPKNAGTREVLDKWHTKCQRLATYDYALLHTDYWQKDPRLPVPLVSGTVDRARYLYRLGALDGGCQASTESFPYNPWNFYAYPRIRWNMAQTADQLLQEFFSGYYREAGAPMLAYYKVLEDHLIANDISLHFQGCCYGVTPGSFPLSVLAAMKKHLEEADQRARSWVVKQRVATAREGFEWVIQESGLKGVDLDDRSNFPTIGPGTNTIDLKRMKKWGGGAAGNFAELSRAGEWFYGAMGRIQAPLNFLQAGKYTVTVSARSIPYLEIGPTMNVFVGGKSSTFVVSSRENKEYSFTTDVLAGVWDLTITYNNAAEGGRRNLIVSAVRIARQ